VPGRLAQPFQLGVRSHRLQAGVAVRGRLAVGRARQQAVARAVARARQQAVAVSLAWEALVLERAEPGLEALEAARLAPMHRPSRRFTPRSS